MNCHCNNKAYSYCNISQGTTIYKCARTEHNSDIIKSKLIWFTSKKKPCNFYREYKSGVLLRDSLPEIQHKKKRKIFHTKENFGKQRYLENKLPVRESYTKNGLGLTLNQREIDVLNNFSIQNANTLPKESRNKVYIFRILGSRSVPNKENDTYTQIDDIAKNIDSIKLNEEDLQYMFDEEQSDAESTLSELSYEEILSDELSDEDSSDAEDDQNLYET